MAAFNLEGHQAGDPGRQRAGWHWKEEARATPFLPMLGVVVITQLHQIVPSLSYESQEYGCKGAETRTTSSHGMPDQFREMGLQKVTELAETTSYRGMTPTAGAVRFQQIHLRVETSPRLENHSVALA